MSNSVVDRARMIIRQAADLRDKVRRNLEEKRYLEDDVQMMRYNTLITEVASLFPNDTTLQTALILMPDKTIQIYASPWAPGLIPSDMVTRRLEERLSILIDQLELLLGEPIETLSPSRSARDILRSERSDEMKRILESIETLRHQQSNLPQVEERSFSFIQDTRLRQILVQDFLESQRAYAAGAYKPSAILSAGLVEGMLLDTIRKPSIETRHDYQTAVAKFAKIDSGINWDKVSLIQLLGAACQLGLLDEQSKRFVEGARDYRDTVHPNAELRLKTRAGNEEAELLLALVKLIYRQLATVT